MNIAHLFARNGQRAGEHAAIAMGESTWADHRTLATNAARIAHGLQTRHRLSVGDRVAIIASNRPDYIELLVACWWAGLAAVPINSRLHKNELAYIIECSGARLTFADPDLEVPDITPVIAFGSREHRQLHTCDALTLHEVKNDALAWLFFTSGTTGRPKGAMITHGNLRAMTYAYFIDIDTIAPDDCILHSAPLSHGSGLYMLPHAAKGACQVIPETGGFDPAETHLLWRCHQGTTMFAAPTMVKRLTRHVESPGRQHNGLKTIVYGGAPMYAADLDHAHKTFGFKLAQLYGQGEAPMTITALDKRAHADVDHSRYASRIRSAGTAQTVTEVKIADAECNVLPFGQPGEIMARGAIVVPGYWQDPDATARTMADGWLRTGDIGVMDEDGFVTLVDRSKDLIISGGSNIYPREIEEVLLTHKYVREVAVIGIPDDDWGESVVACLVADPELPDSELDRLCLAHIARFKRPKRYVRFDSLPKNNYGKILKTTLRAKLSGS